MLAEDGPVIEIKNETKDGEEKDQINYKTNQRKLNETNKFLPEWDSRISRIVCQFFIFGTLFGVVCSISACTCLLQPNHGGENNFSRNEPRLSIAPPVEENTKPIRIQFLEDGYCYATEMANNEIPPLPDYKSALKMPCDVFSILNRQISTIVGQPQTSEESGWLVPSYSNHHFHEKVDDAKLLTNVDSTLNDHVTDISNELVNCENNSQK
uniref:Uncharacterized protein n=1 Tax=Rhabditophanes sp. KR3021 TaxID=114890 RepID=A0AC35UHC9_9BILA